MSHRAIATLTRTLRGHVDLGKCRLDTLCMLVVGMVAARTVNLGHIATAAGRTVLIASTYRRLQRFFQHVDLDPDRAAPILARLIGSEGAWTLALDRTTWKIGSRDVNYLVLAVITRRFRVPLFWTLLDGPGNSATATRIALMRRHLAHFAPSSVRLLLADREFVGAEWLKFLNDSNIKFAIRLREDLRVTTEDGCGLTLYARLRLARRTRLFQARMGLREDAEASDAPLLHFAAKRLEDEWLIVVSNIPSREALAACRKRRAIECMFGDAKTRGTQHRGHPHHRPAQARAPHGARRPRHRLGRPRGRRPARDRRPQAQGARPLRPVLVPHRLRPDPKPPQRGPPRRPRRLAKARRNRSRMLPSQESRVAWFGTRHFTHHTF